MIDIINIIALAADIGWTMYVLAFLITGVVRAIVWMFIY